MKPWGRGATAKAALLSLAVLTGVLAFAGPAGAAARRSTLHIVFADDADGSVTATGAFTAVGTDKELDSKDNVDGSTTAIDLLTFPNGTITVRDTTLAPKFKLNPVTCVGKVSGGGPYKIIGATGAYAGATGEGTFKFKGTIVFDHTANGCSEEPSSSLVIVKAVGTISLP